MLLQSILKKTPNIKGQIANAARELFHKAIDQLSDDEIMEIVNSLEEQEKTKTKSKPKPKAKANRKERTQPPASVTSALRHFRTRSYETLASKGRVKIAEVRGIGDVQLREIITFLEKKKYTVE